MPQMKTRYQILSELENFLAMRMVRNVYIAFSYSTDKQEYNNDYYDENNTNKAVKSAAGGTSKESSTCECLCTLVHDDNNL